MGAGVIIEIVPAGTSFPKLVGLGFPLDLVDFPLPVGVELPLPLGFSVDLFSSLSVGVADVFSVEEAPDSLGDSEPDGVGLGVSDSELSWRPYSTFLTSSRACALSKTSGQAAEMDDRAATAARRCDGLMVDGGVWDTTKAGSSQVRGVCQGEAAVFFVGREGKYQQKRNTKEEGMQTATLRPKKTSDW